MIGNSMDELLLELQQAQQVTLNDFKRQVKYIVRQTNHKVSHSEALERCAQAMGYADYHEVKSSAPDKYSVVVNRGSGGKL